MNRKPDDNDDNEMTTVSLSEVIEKLLARQSQFEAEVTAQMGRFTSALTDRQVAFEESLLDAQRKIGELFTSQTVTLHEAAKTIKALLAANLTRSSGGRAN